MTNEKPKYYFTGTEEHFKDKANGDPGLYTIINEELGLSMTGDNSWFNPQYTMNGKLKNWRLCKRVDNGQLEVWAADGNTWGGWPVYRVWPTADDVYR